MPYPDDFNGALLDAWIGEEETPSTTEDRDDMRAACKAAEIAMRAAVTSLRQANHYYDEVRRRVDSHEDVRWPFSEDPGWMVNALEDLLCITDAEAKLRDWRARR